MYKTLRKWGFFWAGIMILYKYVSFESGMKILQDNTIGFTHLQDFNDPFESTSFGFIDREGVLTKSIQNNAFRNNFSKKYGALSLTSDPLNALMWAHYGVSHTGLVIGFDVNIAGFNDDGFILKAKDGKMEYFKKEPENTFFPSAIDLKNIGNDEYFSFEGEQSDLFKRAFLYKQECWQYEDEVRVVKNLKASDLICYAGEKYSERNDQKFKQKWSCSIHDSRPLYLFHFPLEAIKEVYIGEKTSKRLRQVDAKVNLDNEKEKISPTCSYSYLREICRRRNIDFKRVQVNYKKWKLVAHKIDF